jgi:hypothetical protein
MARTKPDMTKLPGAGERRLIEHHAPKGDGLMAGATGK